MKRKVLLIPLIIFLAIAAALLWQLARNAEGDDKPFVRWIWAGGLMMALGGLLCLFDPRYRKRVSPQKTAPEAV